MAAENRGREVGEGLAGARAGLGQQDAAAAEHAGHGRGHVALARAGLEVRDGPRERAVVGEHALDERG